jgi:hypothetical protein
MTVPPLVKEIAVGEVRHLIGLLAASLVTQGYLTTGAVSGEAIAGISLAIVTMALSAVSKIGAKQKLVVALASPAGTTETNVTSKIALGLPVPSVLTPPDVVPVPVKLHG